jgi:imidazolonepropionase-like amidohydrolase
MQKLLTLAFACMALAQTFAQQTFPVPAPSDTRPEIFAFTNATIYTDYKTRVEGATLVVQEGKVVAAGLKVAVPQGAVVTDCSGKTIYPAFIDLYASGYGLGQGGNTLPSGGGRGDGPQANTNRKGPFAWNEALRPDYNAADNFSPDAKAAEEWRKMGFGALLVHQADGIVRGTGTLVALNDDRSHESILIPAASSHHSFRKGSSKQSYPSSLMGCIALVRQTHYDARWYAAEGRKEEYNAALEAWLRNTNLPQVFDATDKLDVLRIGRIGKEFGVNYLVKTAGDEYQRLEEIKALNYGLIVPLNYPTGYDVRDPYDAQNISLRELKHWELAPSNPGQLASAGIPFAITTADLKDKTKFMANLRKAIEHGLSEEVALRALTFQPATMLGCYDRIGSLEPGKFANFIITSGNVFEADAKIYQTWSRGKGFAVRDFADDFPSGFYGEYSLILEGDMVQSLFLQQKKSGVDAFILNADSTKTKVAFDLKRNAVTLSWLQDTVAKKSALLAGMVNAATDSRLARMSGRGTYADGRPFDWSLQQVKKADPPKPTKQNPVKTPETGGVMYPFMSFGQEKLPTTGVFLIKNATVWTNEKDGVIKNSDVLIQNGKIAKIGRNLPVQDNATVVDGTGKHLTAGIIDEHSHIAASRSINEGTQESSAEVRIGDVIDSEDIDIYRQLAGGVTSSHILHGSSNPIGGQTQLIKLRWGYAPEAMKFQNWPGFIKFALGENVKQSNWGDNFRTRYPQTRMGVEQVYVDYFSRAKEYNALKKSGKPYRTDLDLEALGEILESKRFITCHSYVQSEIVMLMRVAEQFGFKVNTFTHILEGYKVADKMAKHGAGGSSFADWWAYKMEVYDAIPYNAAMMQRQGVTVAINSDDAEMARRLNQEAAKAVEYGGATEEEALKMVTLNPAKLLRVDDRVGSIKVGKDADLVLWDNHPLSVYANAQTTWVDGIPFYDRTEDARRREALRTERARLIQKIVSEGKGGAGGEKPVAPKHHYHCDSEEDEGF